MIFNLIDFGLIISLSIKKLLISTSSISVNIYPRVAHAQSNDK